MNTKHLLIVSAIMLVGCNSFNRYELPDEGYRRLAAQKGPDVIPKEFLDLLEKEPAPAPQSKCPLYRPPVIPPIPEIPFRELAALNKGDTDGLDRLQQEHINALRIWGTSVSLAQKRAYREYLKACGEEPSK